MKLRKQILLLITLTIVIGACKGSNTSLPDKYKMPENTISVKGSVHELTLTPDPPPTFPEHEGKAEFMSYCGICHSLKYITMQPDFPAKTWDAEVTKMIVKYHAPIDSVNAKKILDYLVSIKGKK